MSAARIWKTAILSLVLSAGFNLAVLIVGVRWHASRLLLLLFPGVLALPAFAPLLKVLQPKAGPAFSGLWMPLVLMGGVDCLFYGVLCFLVIWLGQRWRSGVAAST